jgi:hypothetical protein
VRGHNFPEDTVQTSIDTFLEARLAEDTALPADDLQAKRQIIDLYRLASKAPELDRDAWLVMKQTLHILASRYDRHPDYAKVPELDHFRPRIVVHLHDTEGMSKAVRQVAQSANPAIRIN